MCNGVKRSLDGLGEVSDGLRMVSHGIGKETDGLLKVSHGLGTVSDGLGNVYVYVYEKKGKIMKIFTNSTKAS